MSGRVGFSYHLGMSITLQAVERVFREESGRIMATLIRKLDDFDLAEEAMQEAMASALETWPVEGLPEHPGAWISTVAKNKAIDRLRREKLGRAILEKLEYETKAQDESMIAMNAHLDNDPEDDRLKLIFTCCHPALNLEAQVALTLPASFSARTSSRLGRPISMPWAMR